MQVELARKELDFLKDLCEICVIDFFDVENPDREDEKIASLAYNLHNRFERIILKGERSGRVQNSKTSRK